MAQLPATASHICLSGGCPKSKAKSKLVLLKFYIHQPNKTMQRRSIGTVLAGKASGNAELPPVPLYST
jgi:hypothetical protein